MVDSLVVGRAILVLTTKYCSQTRGLSRSVLVTNASASPYSLLASPLEEDLPLWGRCARLAAFVKCAP